MPTVQSEGLSRPVLTFCISEFLEQATTQLIGKLLLKRIQFEHSPERGSGILVLLLVLCDQSTLVVSPGIFGVDPLRFYPPLAGLVIVLLLSVAIGHIVRVHRFAGIEFMCFFEPGDRAIVLLLVSCDQSTLVVSLGIFGIDR